MKNTLCVTQNQIGLMPIVISVGQGCCLTEKELNHQMIEIDVIAFLLGVATIPIYTRLRNWYRYRQWRIKEDIDIARYAVKKKARIQKDLDTWLNWLPYGLEEGDAEAIIDEVLWSDEREILYEMVNALRDVFMFDLKDVLQVVSFDTERKELTFAIRTDFLPYDERLRITSTIRDEANDSAQEMLGEMGLASMGDITFAIIGEFEHE